MKLSFSIASTSNPKPPRFSFSEDDQVEKQYVTQFDSSQTLPDNNRNRNFLIPPIENEWGRRIADAGAEKMSYGLNIRTMEDEGNKSKTEDLMLEKLRYDLKRLPEDPGFEQFEDLPVEGFGAALLAGYGWYEGRGIGRNAKQDVRVKQFEKKTGRGGLGFVSHDTKTTPAYIKDREKNPRVRDGDGNGLFIGKDARVVAGSRGVVDSKGTIVKR